MSHDPLRQNRSPPFLSQPRQHLTNFRLLLTSGLAEKVSFLGNRTTYYTFPLTAWEKTMATELEAAFSLQKLARQEFQPCQTKMQPASVWKRRSNEPIFSSFLQPMLTEWYERQGQKTH